MSILVLYYLVINFYKLILYINFNINLLISTIDINYFDLKPQTSNLIITNLSLLFKDSFL